MNEKKEYWLMRTASDIYGVAHDRMARSIGLKIYIVFFKDGTTGYQVRAEKAFPAFTSSRTCYATSSMALALQYVEWQFSRHSNSLSAAVCRKKISIRNKSLRPLALPAAKAPVFTVAAKKPLPIYAV